MNDPRISHILRYIYQLKTSLNWSSRVYLVKARVSSLYHFKEISSINSNVFDVTFSININYVSIFANVFLSRGYWVSLWIYSIVYIFGASTGSYHIVLFNQIISFHGYWMDFTKYRLIFIHWRLVLMILNVEHKMYNLEEDLFYFKLWRWFLLGKVYTATTLSWKYFHF